MGESLRPSPVVITAALTGSRITKDQTPAIPITPEEIAAEGIAAWKAGAAVVHIHVRDAATGQGSQDMDAFRHVVTSLRAATDVILCLTTSGIPGRNLPTAERIAPLALRPEMASFDAGTIQMDAGLFVNEPEFLDALAAEALARGVKLEFECFTHEMVATALRYHADGKIRAPLHFQFVTGTRHGMPATAQALVEAVGMLPESATWSVIGVRGARRRPWRCWPWPWAVTCAWGSRTPSTTTAVRGHRQLAARGARCAPGRRAGTSGRDAGRGAEAPRARLRPRPRSRDRGRGAGPCRQGASSGSREPVRDRPYLVEQAEPDRHFVAPDDERRRDDEHVPVRVQVEAAVEGGAPERRHRRRGVAARRVGDEGLAGLAVAHHLETESRPSPGPRRPTVVVGELPQPGAQERTHRGGVLDQRARRA